MKRGFLYYALLWAVSLILFNVLVFIVPVPEGMTRFGGSFWPGYIGILIAFLGQLYCGWEALKEKNADRVFLRWPLIRISRTALVFTLIFGVGCIIIPDLPAWFGAVICLVILALTIQALLRASAAAEAVETVGGAVRERTDFFRYLTTEAGALSAYAADETAKNACKKVYEALRYSDPVSAAPLTRVENDISDSFQTFSAAVRAGETDRVPALSEDLLRKIAERNELCKRSK